MRQKNYESGFRFFSNKDELLEEDDLVKIRSNKVKRQQTEGELLRQNDIIEIPSDLISKLTNQKHET